MLILKKPNEIEPIYVLSLEEYLQPKKPKKCTELQQFPGANNFKQSQSRKKRTSAWSVTKVQSATVTTTTIPTTIITQPFNRNKWQQLLLRWQEKRGIECARVDEPVLEDVPCNWRSLLDKLPNVLAFLRARNDDGLCKRKTGFEIYCEMASFHGFVNFVDASTWRRALWFIIICVAIAMSVMVLAMSHLLNVGTPTTIYTESTTHPSWEIPFPAITICPAYRISRQNTTVLFSRLISGTQMPLAQAVHLLTLVQQYELAGLTKGASLMDLQLLQRLLAAKNVSISQMYGEVQAHCTLDMLRCMWQGEQFPCGELFRERSTVQGRCCVFDVDGASVEATTTRCCGPRTGLTVLLRTQRADHLASLYASRIAYELYVHEPHVIADERLLAPQLLTTGTICNLGVQPRQTYATSYMRGERVQRRRCYFANERPLRTFRRYSQVNCLAECWSERAYVQCHCVPVQWPRLYKHWNVCEPTQLPCIAAGRENITRMLSSDFGSDYRHDHYAEQINCNCYPPCEYNQYQVHLDTTSIGAHNDDNDLLESIDGNISDYVLLHVHYDDVIAERLRVDVYENWLSFIGTFGGITGLFMGYSVVSAFEMIFFVFVRPACNWLTKKQIRYRVKRKQRQREKAAMAAKAAAATTTTTAT